MASGFQSLETTLTLNDRKKLKKKYRLSRLRYVRISGSIAAH